ncbi:CRISPR-associated protein Cas8c/Csd1, subtype I-C/DVULG [Geobacillus kaustophilus]|uniref:CRISPR-associated protein Cas8c/Csd1, subtype I-C/DVULG n=1 Tax=Geobacillus kaustophilus TaxID=1462 RepID=A0A0D8BYA9_GEOKU|nr:type I-C CRISPR-associated protein Cas8c/Csd1 [Geobacillus kaustophilus]KJE29173.1 CRISPR-associated protein Cas8c/Csd1, subtype I-C/DVULG [Geobacillus kaustophilus]
MLYALIELGARLQRDKKMPPLCYEKKQVNWIIDLSGETPYLRGPFEKGDYRTIEAPIRQRSGKASEKNVKPYLLVDDARYVLGIPESWEPKKVNEAQLMHKEYVRLIEEAYHSTNMPELKRILNFLQGSLKEQFFQSIKPRDIITFQVNEDSLICEHPKIQQFWVQHLEKELVSNDKNDCSICRNYAPYVRIFPSSISLFGQRPGLTSFNEKAFESMGKDQTNNVPICFRCATLTVDVLNYLLREDKHHTELYRNKKKRNDLQSQMAVYWINDSINEGNRSGIQIDANMFAAILEQWFFDEETNNRTPPPELKQLEELIALPKTGREQALHLDKTFFHMAVLSANKARLVVREWIHTSISQLLVHLERYTTALRIVQPNGEIGHLLPLAHLIRAVDMHPGLVRQCLRMIYQGALPPTELLPLALQRFRLPKVLNDGKEMWRYHALASLLKLALTYGKEEANTMESLNIHYSQPSYICGRLLAVLEEIQQRASGYRIGNTIVHRFYGAASTAPASTFGSLLRLATTAHLPKVSVELGRLLEEVMKQLDEAGGFPAILNLRQQAAFALGFYHQRAEFSNRRQNNQTNETEEKQ